MRIGELAAEAGVNIQTLRYYERRGLLSFPERLASGYRIYDTDAVRRVRFIRRAQELGFTLQEIGDLLMLWSDSAQSCQAVEGRARAALVYAAGDCTSPPGALPLTPVAAYEGIIAASNLLHGNTKSTDYRGTPSVVFTIPPLAAVGLTEADARRQGFDVSVKCEDTGSWFANRRVREPAAMFKTITEQRTDRVLGAHLLGPDAAEVINVFALAIRHGLTASDLKHMIYAYPTGTSDVSYML